MAKKPVKKVGAIGSKKQMASAKSPVKKPMDAKQAKFFGKGK